MDGIEQIMDGDTTIAFVVRASYSTPCTQFVTPDTCTQQLGFIVHSQGSHIQPHVHRPLERVLTNTSEVLVVRSGRVRVDLYTAARALLTSRELATGDIIVLVAGGHGFEMIEDTVLVEVKQGPYIGQDEKVRFAP